MTALKIALIIVSVFDLVLLVAYTEVYHTMRWYKKHFLAQPRVQYRLIPQISWQQRVVNFLLFRKPVRIKQTFKYFNVKKEVEKVS
jgi:hypothetical protein